MLTISTVVIITSNIKEILLVITPEKLIDNAYFIRKETLNAITRNILKTLSVLDF